MQFSIFLPERELMCNLVYIAYNISSNVEISITIMEREKDYFFIRYFIECLYAANLLYIAYNICTNVVSTSLWDNAL